MMKKYYKPLTLIIAFLILGLVTIVSYAYFVANVSGNDTASGNVVTTGNMEVTYEAGETIGVTPNMLPGDFVIKKFSVRNTGNIDATYNIYLNQVVNSFVISNDLVYELTSENGANVGETAFPYQNTMIASNIAIGINETHNYTLKITFKETNENQDVNKGAIFRARIDLKESDDNSQFIVLGGSVGSTMLYLADNGATDLEYDGRESLSEFGTNDNNLRYIGSNPNNYVYYNCSTSNISEMNDETCELWRIIGLMNNIEDDNGVKKSLVKIMRNDSLGKYSWDTSDSSANSSFGVNQWGESVYEDGTYYEGADLMRELNTDYLGNITVGTDGKWAKGYKTRGDMPTTYLNHQAIRMIQNVKWNLGTVPEEVASVFGFGSDLYIAPRFYEYERGNVNGKICNPETARDDGAYCNDNVVRTTTWTGRVGLMYPSDYLYSTSGGGEHSKKDCLNTFNYGLYGFDVDSESDCYNNSWMYSGGWHWTISPDSDTGVSDFAIALSEYGSIDPNEAFRNCNVNPVVYLQPNIKIDSGNGSASNPYKLAFMFDNSAS